MPEIHGGPSQHLVLPEADHGDPPSPSKFGEFKDLTGWLWGAVTAPPLGD